MFSGADNGSLFCRPARLTFRDLLLYFYFNKNKHKRLMEFIDNNLAAARRSKIKAV